MTSKKIEQHDELCRLLHDTYIRKNTAYGDSFGKSYEVWGISAAAIRLTDKFNRFINLAKNPQLNTGDEAITDTLLDMANYALMTILEIEKGIELLMTHD